MNRRIPAFLILAGVVFAGCDILSDPPAGEQVPGIVEWQAEAEAVTAAGGIGLVEDVMRATIEAPDTVDAGVPFAAVITTIGLSGCWRVGGQNIALDDDLAIVTPHEVVEPGFCTGALVDLSREVSLRFDVAGTGTIRVEGRRVVGFDMTDGIEATVERTVVVR